MRPTRVLWKIIVGAVLVLITVSNLPMYFGGSTQANGALAMSTVAIVGGF